MSPDTPETASWPWSALGLEKMPAEPADIRRAYARALKQIDQATDIEGFATLRQAYDAAMTVREGRSQRNAQRRAVKAAKIAALTPTAEDIPPNPAPPPADTSVQDAQTAKDAAIQALVAPLLTDDRETPACKRIFAVLETQLSHDPEAQMILRTACAQLLRDHLRPDFNGNFTLSPQLTDDCLLALDARFGWLNDYIAFRQDFGNNPNLQHELATRAYGNFNLADPLPSSQSGTWDIKRGAIIIGAMITLNVLRLILEKAKGEPYEDTLITILLMLANLGGIWWIYTAQRKKRSARAAMIIAGWFGLFLPLVLFAPDSDLGAQDRPLLLIWMMVTALLAALWLLAPAWQWLIQRLNARANTK